MALLLLCAFLAFAALPSQAAPAPFQSQFDGSDGLPLLRASLGNAHMQVGERCKPHHFSAKLAGVVYGVFRPAGLQHAGRIASIEQHSPEGDGRRLATARAPPSALLFY